MRTGDLALRSKAIPFEALPFDEGDQLVLLPGASPLATQPIRLTRPMAGDLIEAHLTLNIDAAAASGFTLRLAIGTFADALLTATPSYTEDFIAAQHKKLTGKTSGFVVAAGGNLFIDELNLLPCLPPRSETGFSEDGFVLVLAFAAAPSTGTGWSLNAFRATGSVQMGLL